MTATQAKTPRLELTAENVYTVALYCLAVEEEKGTDEVEFMQGIVNDYHWHRGRIAEKSDDIVSMLGQLPRSFHEKTGGGWTFLNACNREDGRQWTGLHVLMESLCCLGIAAGKAAWVMPREFWPDLPGGMPYFVVKDHGR